MARAADETRMPLSKYATGAVVLVSLMLAIGRAEAEPKPDFAREMVETIRVDARRILHFRKSDPALRTFGKLEFRGGLVLSSPSSKFGGWSALEVDADGRRLLALSDAGLWMTASLDYDGSKPAALKDATVGPITGLGGAPLAKERDRDAEGVALVEGSLANGTVLIAFEQNHRIGRFPISGRGLGAPTAYLPLPAEAHRQIRNKALESVCVLRAGPLKGAIVALSERYPDRTGSRHSGWMLPAATKATAGSWQSLSIRNLGGYDLTDCRGLADGSILVLERHFRWSTWFQGVKSRLRRFTAAEIQAGGVMDGEILLDVDMDYEIDNLEGLAAHRPAGARETILTMISDNNFNSILQRTVLLQFALPDAPATPQGMARK